MYHEGIQRSRERRGFYKLSDESLCRIQGSVIFKMGCRNLKLKENDEVLYEKSDQFAATTFDVHDQTFYIRSRHDHQGSKEINLKTPMAKKLKKSSYVSNIYLHLCKRFNDFLLACAV
jgi:hypothetical protein